MGQREHLELLLANMMKCTDFGYAKDFDRRYTIGKLLRHGQFGYTYVATDKANGDHVAVKKIEKIKDSSALEFEYIMVMRGLGYGVKYAMQGRWLEVYGL
ncbi:hypothetical protein QYF36_012109 [Acer negundo]|nr:hypothetical protein QYF36_012109 [Acer negundo]